MGGLKRFYSIVTTYDHAPTELMMGALIMAWGLHVANPALDSLGGMRIGAVMHVIMPEVVWGFGAVAIGGLQLWAVLDQALRTRRAVAMAGGLWWLWLWAMFVLTNPCSTAIALNPILAAAELWCWWRLLRYGGEHDA